MEVSSLEISLDPEDRSVQMGQDAVLKSFQDGIRNLLSGPQGFQELRNRGIETPTTSEQDHQTLLEGLSGLINVAEYARDKLHRGESLPLRKSMDEPEVDFSALRSMMMEEQGQTTQIRTIEQ